MNMLPALDEMVIHAAACSCWRLITKLFDHNWQRNCLFFIGCLLYLTIANVQSEAVKQNTKLSKYYRTYRWRKDVRYHSNERLLGKLRTLDNNSENGKFFIYDTSQSGATRRKLKRQRRSIRFKRNSERQQSNSKVVIWPHSCRIYNKHITSTKACIVYECTPSLFFIEEQTRYNEPLKPQQTAPSEDTSEAKLIATESTNLTNTSSYSTVHTRSIKSEDYALSDVTVQYEVPDYVTELRLWYQGIVSLEPNAFKKIRSTLAVLKLQHNQISYIAKHAFSGLNNLEELDLSYNRIQSLPSLAFAELGKLRTLKLPHNEMYFIQDTLFCGLTSLLTLDISHNAIEEIGTHAFRHFLAMDTVVIELNHNKLKNPKREWFAYTPGLLPYNFCNPSNGNKAVFEPKHANLNSTAANNTEGRNDNTFDDFHKQAMEKESENQKTKNNSSLNSDAIDRLTAVRILRSAHNPWHCSCTSYFSLLPIWQQSSATSQKAPTVTDNSIFRFSENNGTTSYPIFYKWYFTISCSTPEEIKGLELKYVYSSSKLQYVQSCCEYVKADDSDSNEICKAQAKGDSNNETESDHLTDNHVTVIGIVIVFVTPVLLTLCPDCDKTIHPSGSGGMMSAGKFGVIANTSYNNNNRPASIDRIFRTYEPRFTDQQLREYLKTKYGTTSKYKEEIV